MVPLKHEIEQKRSQIAIKPEMKNKIILNTIKNIHKLTGRDFFWSHILGTTSFLFLGTSFLQYNDLRKQKKKKKSWGHAIWVNKGKQL